jgi:RNA polymerase sigma factor (sigma-70 family)
MSKHESLNALYATYKVSPKVGLEPLLAEARRLALRVMQDEDFAQDAVTDLWQVLPDLELPAGTSFSGWFLTRLRWRSIDRRRRPVREEQPPVMGADDEGEPLTDDESLSALCFHQSAPVEIPDTEDRIAAIEDPFIRQVADLLLDGLSQAEIAEQLGVSVGALEQRLYRYRTKKIDLCQAA